MTKSAAAAYQREPVGKLKLATIVLGILAVSFQGSRFGWGGFGSTLGAMLGFYLAMLIIALKLSIILFVVTVLELVEKSKLKKIDVQYHVGMAALLVLGFILMMVSIIILMGSGTSYEVGEWITTISSAIFGGLDTAAYVGVATLLYRAKK